MEKVGTTGSEGAKEYILDRDWSVTSAGSVNSWPRNLQSALEICLASSNPMALYRGGDFLLFCNDALIELFNSSTSSIGLPARDFYKDNWKQIGSCLEWVYSTGKSADVKDHKLSVTGNHDRYFDSSFTPVPDNGEAKSGFGGILHMISETTSRIYAGRKMKDYLLEIEGEQELVADIFHYSPTFMCILRGPDHVFERVNYHYYQLVGNRELIGRAVKEALPELHGFDFVGLLDQVYQTGETISRSSEKIILNSHHPDKSQHRERYLDFVYQPLRKSDGKVNGIFVQGIDLTERKLAEKKLMILNHTLEERVEERTAAMMSYQKQLRSLASRLSNAEEHERQRLATELHDNLGQILAVCKMELDLLKTEQISNQVSEGMDSLAMMMDEAIRYTRELMTDLKPPPSLEEEELGSILTWVSEKMKKHGLQVTVVDDNQTKQINEEIRITLLQAVRELLFNIVKHAEVRQASVMIKRRDDHVEVIVEDEGVGFDPEHETLTEGKHGGFGLFSVWERMDLLGGSLKIISEAGKGTKVFLKAPVKQENNSQIFISKSNKMNDPAFRPPLLQKYEKKIRILLVDDHVMLRSGLKEIIARQNDLRVVGEASNGREAVDLTQKLTPDVIVMDVDMPLMNGIDATRQIKIFAPDVHIIGLSFHKDREVKYFMLNAGASAYLNKSDVFETLCATIRSEAVTGKKKL